MKKTVDAILACRVQGARLYGKPLQTLVPNGITIIESLISYLQKINLIDKIVLAIAEGEENHGFIKIAQNYDLAYMVGDEHNVLNRIIRAAEQENISRVFRITTEGPFVIWEYANKIIKAFIDGDYDWASYNDSPEGTGFELIKTAALEKSHQCGTSRNRSELVTSYICENQDEFNLLFMDLPEEMQRPEVRLTVDYAEDLVFCQRVYKHLKKDGELIPVKKIIEFWDNNSDIRKSVESIGLDWGTGRLVWTDSDKEIAD